jgi:hypothetical protein
MLTKPKPATIKSGAMCIRENGTKFETTRDIVCEIQPGPTNSAGQYLVHVSTPDFIDGNRKLERILVHRTAVFDR